MSSPESSHIQGGLTISYGPGEGGILKVNMIDEETSGVGITTSSSIKTTSDIIFTGTSFNSSLDLVTDDFFIKNDAGNMELLSKGGKGITIAGTSGNVVLTSTTDSIDLNTGSLITNGGAVVKKTLTVGENINCLDGLSSFTNTTGSIGVVDVINTSNSGFSSVSFKDSSNLSKLEIGYGNSLVSSPLTGTSFIQSKNGSELLFRGDSTDSFVVKTNGSIDFFNNTSSTSSTTGSLRLIGGLGISNTTDAVSFTSGGSLTTSGGVSIGKRLFVGGSVNYASIPQPSTPAVNVTSLFMDQTDLLLKSINNTGIVTTYQPSNTKGDLVVHNGTTQTRLPVGVNGYTLVSNSTTSTGVEWVYGSGTSNSNVTTNKYTILGNSKTNVIEYPFGSNMFLTYPRVENGSSCLFFTSKSSANLNGVSVRLNSNSSLSSAGVLSITYLSYQGISISKNYTEGDGDYIGTSNEFFSISNVNLSGASWVNIGPLSTVGTYCFSVSSFSSGPGATFIISKGVSSLLNGNITRIVSTPGTGGGLLRMRWSAGGYPQISKSNILDDGVYRTVDNFQDNSITTTVTLSGTSKVAIGKDIFGYYNNKSFLVSVVSAVSGSPNAIFSVSKNNSTRVGNITRYRSPGTSGEMLNMFWDSNMLLEISKDGVTSDGVYTLVFTKLT